MSIAYLHDFSYSKSWYGNDPFCISTISEHLKRDTVAYPSEKNLQDNSLLAFTFYHQRREVGVRWYSEGVFISNILDD